MYFKCVLIFKPLSLTMLWARQWGYTLVSKLVSFWGLPLTYMRFLGLVTMIIWP